MSIAEAYQQVQEDVASACGRAGRSPEDVTIVAVTKTVDPARVREAWAAGARIVGENRVQELLAKKPALADLDLTWHLIGHLQTNKVRAVLPHVALIHSVDRAEVAIEIARRACASTAVLIQVNTTAEKTKSGADPAAVDRLVDAVRTLPHLQLRGFMTIGPLEGAESDIRRAFASLRILRDRIARGHPDLDLGALSMGMSGDYRLAIEEGSTIVRIGSSIFGARP